MIVISRPVSLRQWMAISILPMFLICVSIWFLQSSDAQPAFPSDFSKIGEVDVDSTSYRALENFKNANSSDGTVFLRKGGLVEVGPAEKPVDHASGQLQQGAVYFIEGVKNVHGSRHEPGYPPEENVLMSYVILRGPNGVFKFGFADFDLENKVSRLIVWKPNDTPEFRNVKAKYDLQ